MNLNKDDILSKIYNGLYNLSVKEHGTWAGRAIKLIEESANTGKLVHNILDSDIANHFKNKNAR